MKEALSPLRTIYLWRRVNARSLVLRHALVLQQAMYERSIDQLLKEISRSMLHAAKGQQGQIGQRAIVIPLVPLW